METGGFEAEWRVIWPDGTTHWLSGRALVSKDDAQQPLRVSGAIADVTDRKQAELDVLRVNAELEQRVRQRTTQLEAANRELEAFAYSVSHDLRAPLRGIDGWSLALLEDYGGSLDDAGRQYLNRVRSETQRMGHLIDDMLQLSRVSRGEMKADPVDLASLANGITAKLQDAQPERSMEFVIEPHLVASGDGRLLDIALTNLLSNAVKFTGTRNKALIEFGRIEKEGEMAFYVRDNGVGFDMAHTGNLFGAFQRLHKVSEFPGSGIGLATVQRVVRRHGGRVWAEAFLDRGATFWFTLGGRS
jgi:signal transduction histidine kinase